MHKITRLEFRGKINGLVAESIKLRKKIHASRGDEKAKCWQEKRQLGQHTRHVMLAYAYIRGIPYEKVERKIAEGNFPDVHLIYLMVQENKAFFDRYDYHVSYKYKWPAKDSVRDVENWIGSSPTNCWPEKPSSVMMKEEIIKIVKAS